MNEGVKVIDLVAVHEKPSDLDRLKTVRKGDILTREMGDEGMIKTERNHRIDFIKTEILSKKKHQPEQGIVNS